MRTETGKAVKLSDYRVPDFLVEQVDLDFRLHPSETLVISRLRVSPNPAGRKNVPLIFDGDGLNVLSVSVDGKLLNSEEANISPDGLTIFEPPRNAFTLETRTRVNPAANTQLSGLFSSGGVYCTQCEAEGFRRITYFPDRPDILSVYTTRIEADVKEAPVLLGNGNPLAKGDAGNGRHFAIWHDPYPKPSYLFALVGGNLGVLQDEFTTASGRMVKLGIYVEHGKENRAHYAMDALKRSMKWDEEKFGREYDLDIFNIVAVSDFNMGAMENKGLNIFNDKYVLASPDTATDNDYAGIETVIAHEYFHNWTGNRITCRDWFQLCLKEGLTVYRDQEFSADQRSRPVKRIADVRGLRAAQFTEDAGPLAHNVRPELYHEINNFYTATVYQKGAEVIRTLRHFIGDEAFRRGMDIYFDRFDGTAATVEDFISCFSEASRQNLDQFMLWYSQAGTPHVKAKTTYDPVRKTLTLDLSQTIPDTPGQTGKMPHVLPVKLGLIAANGEDIRLHTASEIDPAGASANELTTSTFILNTAARRIEFQDVDSRPALSLFRELSAPVRINVEMREADYLALAAHDSDLFNRWQAIQTLATQTLLRSTAEIRKGNATQFDTSLVAPFESLLSCWEQDPEFTAQALALPGDNEIVREIGTDVDPEAVFQAGRRLRHELGTMLSDHFNAVNTKLAKPVTWSADAYSAGCRSMRGIVLAWIMASDKTQGAALALNQFRNANNMTDKISSLGALATTDGPERELAFDEFHATYRDDHLIMDKWFTLQAIIPEAATLDRVRSLMKHPLFSMTNPNRFRALVSSFAMMNPSRFNALDGTGYHFIADMVLELDTRNPQVAARLLVAFRSWRTLEAIRKGLAQSELQRIAAQPGLSADVRDIVSRSLA